MDKFDIWTAILLADLISNFPVPIDISPRDFSIRYNDDENNGEIYAEHLIKWLEQEGYIRHKDVFDGGDCQIIFSDVVLTEKALISLRKKPSVLYPDDTVGDLIVSNVKEIGSEAAKNQITAAIGEFLGGFTKSLFS